MKRAWLGLALLLSLGINLGFVGIAVARHRAIERLRAVHSGEMPLSQDFPGRIADELRLAPESRPRFLALQLRLAERTVAGRREIFDLRQQLRAELLQPEPDRDHIDELLAELGRREAELNRALVDSLLESREMLQGQELERYLLFLDRFAPGRPGGSPGPGAGAGMGPRQGARRPFQRP